MAGGYSLAKKRNIGQVSSDALVRAVAGDEINGALRDRHIVTKYEHRLCMAQRLVSKELYDTNCGRVDVGSARSARVFEAHCLKGDATNQEACDKEKVHVAQVFSCIASPSETGTKFECAKSLCDLQVSRLGTGAELYEMAQRELRSVHAPSWADRLQQYETEPEKCDGDIAVFAFGFDAGPENTLMTKMVCSAIGDCSRVMMGVVWCFLHQSHIVVRSVLDHIDAFEWDEFWGSEAELEVWNSLPFYTTAVSNISSAWRAPGSVRKLTSAGSETFHSEVRSRIGGTIPGRVVRGRWGSIDSVEKIISEGGALLGAVFTRAFMADKKQEGCR